MGIFENSSLQDNRTIPVKSRCCHISLSITLFVGIIAAFAIAAYVFNSTDDTIVEISREDGPNCSPTGISLSTSKGASGASFPPGGAFAGDGYKLEADKLTRDDFLRLLDRSIDLVGLPFAASMAGSAGWRCISTNLLSLSNAALDGVVSVELDATAYSAVVSAAPNCASPPYTLSASESQAVWTAARQKPIIDSLRLNNAPFQCVVTIEKTKFEVAILAFSTALTVQAILLVVLGFINRTCNTAKDARDGSDDVGLGEVHGSSSRV
jgi:hypothetical protein